MKTIIAILFTCLCHLAIAQNMPETLEADSIQNKTGLTIASDSTEVSCQIDNTKSCKSNNDCTDSSKHELPSSNIFPFLNRFNDPGVIL